MNQRLMGLPRLCGPAISSRVDLCLRVRICPVRPCEAAWTSPPGARPCQRVQAGQLLPAPWPPSLVGCSQDSTHLPGDLLVGHRETHDAGVGVQEVPGVHMVGVTQVLRLLPAVQLRVLPLQGRLGGWGQPHERGQSWPSSRIWPTGWGTLHGPSSGPCRSPARCSPPHSPQAPKNSHPLTQGGGALVRAEAAVLQGLHHPVQRSGCLGHLPGSPKQHLVGTCPHTGSPYAPQAAAEASGVLPGGSQRWVIPTAPRSGDRSEEAEEGTRVYS